MVFGKGSARTRRVALKLGVLCAASTTFATAARGEGLDGAAELGISSSTRSPAMASTSSNAGAWRDVATSSTASIAERWDGGEGGGDATVSRAGGGAASGRDPLDVVVHAARAPRAASDWSVAIGVQPSAPQAGGSGADLLRRAPGFHISQHSGEGKAHQIFLRGFDAVHGQDTEIAAGGVPVNEVSHVHGQGYADLHFLIPEAVRSLRVVEGPYDARQGDFAIAGSVDFDLGFTERGIFGRTSVGQFGLVRALVAFAPEDTPAETFVAGEFARGDGFGPSRAWSRASALAQALVGLGSGLQLRLLANAHAGRFDSAGVVRLDDVANGRIDRFGTYDPHQGGASARHSALLELTHRDAGSTSVLSTYFVLRDLRLRQDFTGFLLSDAGDLSEQTQGSTTFGGRATHVRHFFDRRISSEIGAVFRFDRIEQSQRRLRSIDGRPQAPRPGDAGSVEGTRPQNDVDAELAIAELGLYGDAHVRLPRGFGLRAGLRGEAQSYAIFDRRANAGLGERRDAFGYLLAPKVTVEYAVLAPVQVFASYGRGFRSPQALDLAQSERSTFTRVHSGEVGARAFASDWGTATLAGFVTHVGEDLVFDAPSGRTTSFGPTTRTGGTIFLAAEPAAGLRAALSGTFTRAVHDESGALVPFVPPLVVRLDASAHDEFGTVFDLPWGLFGSLGLTGLGPRPLPFGERADPVFWTEAAAGIEVGPVSLSVEVFNVLDARWNDGEFVYASNFDAQRDASLVPRRHVTAGRPFSAQATLTFRP